MAKERRHLAGEVAAFQVASVARMLVGERVDFRLLNPYRDVPPLSPEARRLAAADAKAEFRAGLRAMFRKQKG